MHRVCVRVADDSYVQRVMTSALRGCLCASGTVSDIWVSVSSVWCCYVVRGTHVHALWLGVPQVPLAKRNEPPFSALTAHAVSVEEGGFFYVPMVASPFFQRREGTISLDIPIRGSGLHLRRLQWISARVASMHGMINLSSAAAVCALRAFEQFRLDSTAASFARSQQHQQDRAREASSYTTLHI
jgi:hypothetical protein